MATGQDTADRCVRNTGPRCGTRPCDDSFQSETAPDDPAEQDAWIDARIAVLRARRNVERTERKEQARRQAHTLREIAAHLHRVAVVLEHHPLDADEAAAHTLLVDELDALTTPREALPKPKPKQDGEPFTFDELRTGWVRPLGGLWAAWTQAFNRSEFAEDRDALVSVTRTLKALADAYWENDLDHPKKRDKMSTRFLEVVGTAAHRYLAPRNEDLIEDRPDAIRRLVCMLAEEMHEPFFVWSAPSEDLLRTRRDPADAELGELATKLAERFVDALDVGYAFAELKAQLPVDFASEERRSTVRALLYEHLREKFNPGPEAHDYSSSVGSARSTLRALLEALGHPKAKSIFDAERKRAEKLM